jgi:hypothetical protein
MLALRQLDDRLALQRQQELLQRAEQKRLIRLARQAAPVGAPKAAPARPRLVPRPRLALPWG